MIEGLQVTGSRGVIATGPAGGARAGAGIFESGGNAMDAAAAACLACAILEPQAVDLGGYVAAGVVLDGQTGQVWSIDANSIAPAAAREDMYEVLPAIPGKSGINELEYNCSVRDDANVYGPLAVGVPGFLAGVGILHERWGRLKWPEIVAPARALLDAGLSYDLIRADFEKKRDVAPDIVREGNWPSADLARTLDRIAVAGWRDFYEGELGRTIADAVQAAGGILSRADMAGFMPRVTEPLAGRFRDANVYTSIPPNGGYSALEALADYERDPNWGGVLERMWSRRLNPDGGTVHVAAADSEGNLVSMTISQGGLFGSCFAVPGTGVMLGHGMCRFDPHPGLPNSPAPGKRPLNNVCPMIVRMPDRDVAIGARGGRRIVSVVPQLVQRIVDGATVYEAVEPAIDPIVRAHGAEILKGGGLRAAGNTWAVGI